MMSQIEFPRTPVRFLQYFIKMLTAWQRAALILIVVIVAAVTTTNVLMFYGFQLLVDGIPNSDPHGLWKTMFWPFLIIAGCCIFHLVMCRVREVIDALSMPQIQNALRDMLLRNVMLHSHDYFHNRFSGELANKIGNIGMAARNLFSERFLNGLIPAIFSILSSCFLLWLVDPNLSWGLVAAVAGLCVSSYFISPTLGQASARLADCEADISGQIVDTVTNISSVKNNVGQGFELALLQKVQRPYLRAYRQLTWWNVAFWGMFDVILCALVIGFMAYLIQNWSLGRYTAGQVAICTLIAWDMWWRLGMLSWHLTQISGDLGRMQSALNEFVQPLGVADDLSAVEFAPQDGAIQFANVSFAYAVGKPVFTDFSLDIPASQKIGIVGLSGAGKTTLCQLLLRNSDVTGGEILIGGQNISQVTQDSLRRKIAVIPQDPSLFHRSLYENILYGRPDAGEDDVIAAAKAAQAHDFIMASPDGYNTMVGERGVKLSGGQRQRIAIARAILKNASILILDEATSALDSDTERLIQAGFDNAMHGRTTLVVAHRLSTLAHLDRIIVLKNGQIIEDGTLDSLVAADGHFAYLWNLQAGGFLPEKI